MREDFGGFGWMEEAAAGRLLGLLSGVAAALASLLALALCGGIRPGFRHPLNAAQTGGFNV